MPRKKQENPQVVSVRLPHELVRRLDRYVDWSAYYRRVKSSRNTAIRDALSYWQFFPAGWVLRPSGPMRAVSGRLSKHRQTSRLGVHRPASSPATLAS